MTMDSSKNILVAGAGKIGCSLAAILATIDKAHITLVDKTINSSVNFVKQQNNIARCQCDVQDASVLFELIQKNKINAIVSCLPYFCNFSVAEVAKANGCHYFDLTEDVKTTHDIFALASDADTAFVPQCGIAPGFTNIIAANFIKECDSVDSVKLFCGALPNKSTHTLGYALTWSTEGLINEYINPARIIDKGKLITAPSLSALESVVLNGETYEAFHTSGGIGTLVDTYKNHVQTMYYKTMRFPSHCEKMQFLMNDLKLRDDRDTLKRILENAVPTTMDDFVIVHVSVHGIKNKKPIELNDTRRFTPQKIGNTESTATAIQLSTSTAAATVISTVLSNPQDYHGPIKQEDFDLNTILNQPIADYLKGS